MISKKITAITICAFLTTTLFGHIPVKALDKVSKNNIKESNIQGVQVAKTEAKAPNKKLTVMVYSDADNNLEQGLLEDIEEMKVGYVDNSDLNVIALVDRTPDYSDDETVLGENFSDARMYKIENNKVVRIEGGKNFPDITKTSQYEANMGDAQTLKKFIDSCKANYPADKYALIMSNHGGGVRKDKSLQEPKNPKAVCWDDTNDEDCLYTGEISDVLTNDESVNVLAYDACLMGAAEIAYQYRPGNGGFQANVMVASAPIVWGEGFKYDNIFKRLKAGGGKTSETDLTLKGKEQNFDPSTVTDLQLGALMVEEQRDAAESAKENNQVLSCFDLSKIEILKNSVDKMAISLWEENKKADIERLRGTEKKTTLLHYFDENDKREWLSYPYFDLYDLCRTISTDSAFSTPIKKLATTVMQNVDDVVVYSYGGKKFKGFTEGKTGLSVFLPDGNKMYRDVTANTSYSEWKGQRWYNSIDTTILQPDYLYGKLNWCKDGQTPKINDIGNWFELLDCWFDSSNGANGGDNGYQW
ncbi:clostripain [Clostridium tagluense]|uniref:clostripain n=1 Tax=Clostridium tagluense TaxID=360422 RepID=UPI001CF475FB|nr:clostripain [Clostridium tagluense]MCB2314195.1 clostripain [Clostridium tagluense]MCB2319056.1 clostripain [Clostridium tagluense]MCB2323924.1 clostripain [Clostridium tagluense]MCB2328791.1 clostripain [Clostridium tagluense]MCB2333680.1 clostripain [Clostridium tagluense]